ncbi:MAG: thiamine pyrophosphate-dependent enzyme [Bacteroidia bacterium]
MARATEQNLGKSLSVEEFRKTVLNDYRIANESRQASLLGRKEVLTGKAKFGIFGDGKEVAQIAMAKAFRDGDHRAGYYRDQTFMMACGLLTVQEFFAQLYAHPSVEAEPSSAGRSMNGHYGTRMLDKNGMFKNQMENKNSTSDISPLAAQMPRLLGLALASKVYRNTLELKNETAFSNKGNEVAFGTIGDASTSEGLFFETINAAGVLQVPLAISVWDDGYGISVPKKVQTTKESISEALRGFIKEKNTNGIRIYTAKGWDYPGLCELYEKGIAECRETHVPVLFHIQDVTQPQGHSTSGSHERYKGKERLDFETEFDCILKMREWLLANAIATTEELDEIEENAKKYVRDAKKAAWDAFNNEIKQELRTVSAYIDFIAAESANADKVNAIKNELSTAIDPVRKDVIAAVRKVLRATRFEELAAKQQLQAWYKEAQVKNADRYNSYLHSQSAENALAVKAVAPNYSDASPMKDGREVLKANFEKIFATNNKVLAFGEDLGKIGDVNQAFEGLQAMFGENRIFDTGIREASIAGKGIGLAIRGLRPIAEIQYLDYLLYAIQILSDDLASLHYRTKGGQKAPVIIRTRGHRLEGIWHSGSPMGMIINSLRGIYVLVPRNMTQAAGFYNTMLAADDPAIIIEPLNGYRIKERLPDNIGEFRTPLGIPEILSEGTDVTLVTYGSCCRIAQEAVNQLKELGISVELIDVQTLLPFDVNKSIVESIKKTNRVLFLDEDVPGGAAAYMMQQVVEGQQAWQYLDSEPKTLSAKPHRPAYGSDGDYFSKPSVEDVVEAVYSIMHDADPDEFPEF